MGKQSSIGPIDPQMTLTKPNGVDVPSERIFSIALRFSPFLLHNDEKLFLFLLFCVKLIKNNFLSHLNFTIKQEKNRCSRVNGMTRKRKTV